MLPLCSSIVHEKSTVKIRASFSLPVLGLLLLITASSLSSRQYNPFVWSTYKEFSHIYSITMDMEKVYFGTDEGILRFNRIKREWDIPITGSNGFKGSKAEIIAVDPVFNKLWIISDQSIFVYNDQISLWEREIPRISLALSTITSIGFTHDTIFLEGNSGIYASPRGSCIWEHYSWIVPSTTKWFGKKAQLSVTDYPFLTPYYATDEYFNKYEYAAIAVENKDMWLGTNQFGVFHYNTFTWNGIHYVTGLANERVNAIYRDEDHYWIGGIYGTNKGITSMNFVTGEGKHWRSDDVYGISSNNVHAITGTENAVWIGTSAGLLRYDKNENTWKSYTQLNGLVDNTVTALHIKNDTLFIGTAGGFCLIVLPSKNMVILESFDNVMIYALATFLGDLVIATERGVYLWRKKAFETITDPDGDLAFGVTALFVDKNAIWFGTRRKGIDVYYPDSTQWEEFLPPTTICGESVYAISGNEHYVWIGTNNGVSRYNKKTKAWTSFTKMDGIADNEVRAILVEDDCLWLGTKKGLTCFHYTDPSVPP